MTKWLKSAALALGLALALSVVTPVKAQSGPYSAQIQRALESLFSNPVIWSAQSGTLPAVFTLANGQTWTTPALFTFTTGAAEAATRVAGTFNYFRLSNAATATKAGFTSEYEITSGNDNTMSAGSRAILAQFDAYGPSSHQYTGSIVGVQTNVALHNAGGAVNTFGTFTQLLTDTSANIGQMRGGYFEANNSAPVATGNVTTMYGVDAEVVSGSGAGVNTAYAVYVDANGPGDFHTFYGVFVDAPAGSPTFSTAKWSFYNNDSSAPARSLSNWRAPFFATEASATLTITANTIAPANGVVHVGAGLIKTITVPSMCSPTCSVTLVPDAAFTTDATGNISIASTAVVNQPLTMTWDGTKWNPSYTTGGATPGGSNGDIQVNNAGAFGGLTPSGNAYDWFRGDKTFGMTMARGTITTSSPWSFTQTWNAAVVFDALNVTITRTSSSAGSKYLHLLNGTHDVFSVVQDSTNANSGCLELNKGSANTDDVAIKPASIVGSRGFLFINVDCTSVGTAPVYVGGLLMGSNTGSNPFIQMKQGSGGSLTFGSNIVPAWTNTSQDATATLDTGFARNAAGVVEVNNGTAGTFRDIKTRVYGLSNTDGTSFIEGSEQSAPPSAPAANAGRIFFQDNGAGKTQLCVIFNTGAAQCFATQP